MAGERGRAARARRDGRRRPGLRTLVVAGALGTAVLGGAGTLQSRSGAAAVPVELPTGDRCMACHNGLTTARGEDVSLGTNWRATMMANSARDPYWQAGVRREVMDHPTATAAIEAECSICHMPLAHVAARTDGRESQVFAHLPVGRRTEPEDLLAADGVSCAVCHQMEADRLGDESTFTGRFVIDTATTEWGRRRVYGPFQVDTGRVAIMSSAAGVRPTEGLHVQQSELCASCHTLYTHALAPDGAVIGELPEQVPYLEWRHSAFRREQSCQSCHMPVVADSLPITSVWGRARAGLSRHDFRGGNFLVLRMLARYRDELGVAALPQELDRAADRTLAHLASEAAALEVQDARVEAGILSFRVSVTNLTGHKLPTAYPSRRAWLHVTVTDAGGRTVFESGRVEPGGAITGNDNDLDAARFEPHHSELTSPDQVQIYESVMAGPDGRITTGLLTAVAYAKDNRLLPRGFDKETAEEDIAVRGGAAGDPDFVGGGDLLPARVAVGTAARPLRIAVELLYQPIAFRWAENLSAYDALEPRRFLGWYREMAGAHTATLAVAGVAVP